METLVTSYSIPLFDNMLFDASNGPASQEIATLVNTCSETDITEIESYSDFSETIWEPDFRKCLQAQGLDINTFSLRGKSAYIEAIKAQPLRFTEIMLDQSDIMLGSPTQNEGSTIWPGNFYCRRIEWCESATYITFRISVEESDLYNRIISYPSQLYLTLVPGQFSLKTGFEFYNYIALASFVAFTGFLLLVTDNLERFTTIGILSFIMYSTLVTVSAHVFILRYILPTSPFHSILSGLAITVIFQTVLGKRATYLARVYWTHQRAIRFIGYGMITITSLASTYLMLSAQTPPEPYVNKAIVDVEEYLATEISDAVVYNPNIFNLNWRNISIFLDENQLNRDDLASLAQWKATLQPNHLSDIGIDYLIVDQVWLEHRRFDGDAHKLDNDQLYELTQQFGQELNIADDSLFLYRVIPSVQSN